MDDEFVPISLRENWFSNPEIEGVPDESMVVINRSDWLDFLDNFINIDQEQSQRETFYDYIDRSENDSVIYSTVEQLPDVNYQGYQMAMENYQQDSDEMYSRLTDETDYGEMYDNSYLIDN